MNDTEILSKILETVSDSIVIDYGGSANMIQWINALTPIILAIIGLYVYTYKNTNLQAKCCAGFCELYYDETIEKPDRDINPRNSNMSSMGNYSESIDIFNRIPDRLPKSNKRRSDRRSVDRVLYNDIYSQDNLYSRNNRRRRKSAPPNSRLNTIREFENSYEVPIKMDDSYYSYEDSFEDTHDYV